MPNDRGIPILTRSRLLGNLSLCLFVTFLTNADPGLHAAGSSPGQAGRLGTLQGQITLGPELNSKKARFNLYPDLSVVTPRVAPGGPEASNVVIYLESPSLADLAAHQEHDPRVMEQRGQAFVPHVLPIVKGTLVEFPNADPIFHNVFSLSRTASFDLGRYPSGSSRFVRFEKAGVVKVFCHIHSDMSAIVMVLDNPYFATPDTAGHYELARIPPGEYTVSAWHERARPIHRQIVIRPGETTSLDFAIPLRDQPEGE